MSDARAPADEAKPSKIERPRGTRDFGPAEMSRRRAAEAVFRRTFDSFGFREIATPTFEHLELFTAKSGQGIVEELYDFEDKSGRKLTLRPELTAPVLRFYVNEMSKEPKPLKLYYFGSCFRYERPQSGRYREFWQFGTELIGPSTPEADAEVIGLAVATLRNLGMPAGSFHVRVGHVGILKAALGALPVDDRAKADIYRLIDKKDFAGLDERIDVLGLRDRIEAQVLRKLAETRQLVRLADAGADLARAVESLAAELAPASPALAESLRAAYAPLAETVRLLGAYGLEEVTVDLGVARGLDYYTGMVFEIEAPDLGAEKQVTGGGAYALAELFGGEAVGSAGFGMGFDRILLALDRVGATLPGETPLDAYVVAIGDAARREAVLLANKLRRAGLRCDLDLARRKPGKAMDYANARGARRVLLLGEKEMEEGVVTVKDMATGEQVRVPRTDVVARLRAE